MPKFDKILSNLYTYKEVYIPSEMTMNHIESPIKDIVDNLKDNELWASILEEVIGASDVDWLKQIEQEITQDQTRSWFDKLLKKISINIKGHIVFGDEWKDAIAQEKENKKKKTKKNTEQGDVAPEITSEKYDTQNIKIIQEALTQYDITNTYIQKAILATIAKESWFKPQIPEKSYKDTPNKRIREIFGARVSGLSDNQLTTLKANEQAFRDRVYGPDDPTGQSQKLGNTQPWDGMKYRGRWFNGITFKNTYKKYGDIIGVDLVKNPELLEKPDIAAKVNAAYFAEWLKNPTIIQKYGNKNGINDFSSFTTALQAAVNINAWIGKDINSKNLQENYNKALAAAKYLNNENIV